MSKINVATIVSDHLATLYDFGSKKLSKMDLVVFYVLLAIASVACVALGIELRPNVTGILAVSGLVLVGLLLNLLVLVCVVGGSTFKISSTARRFAREVFCNISYAAFVAFVVVAALVAMLIVNGRIATIVGSAFVFTLLGHLFLTLLMVLKRLHVFVHVDWY